jgi:hypothetical protein
MAAAEAAGVGQAYLQAVSPLVAGQRAQQGAAAAAVPISLVESPLAPGSGTAGEAKGRRGSGGGGSPGASSAENWHMTCSDEVGALGRPRELPPGRAAFAAVALLPTAHARHAC